MESGGHRSGGATVHGAGAEGAGGLLCHACGYQYPNAHPSAKQRRAHRKHCGKPASSPTAVQEEEGGAGEPRGRALFPGEGVDPGVVVVGGGDGAGATAAECGGGRGSLGSAPEAASAAPDADKTERSSHDDAVAQAIVDKCVEDRGDVASEVPRPETNRSDDSSHVNKVAADYSSVKASDIPEEEVPSAVPISVVSSSVQLQDASVPVLQTEAGHGGAVSPELPVSEMQNSNAVSLASDATGSEIPEQTKDVISEPNGTTVTGEGGIANTVGTDTLSEEKSVKAADLDSSLEDNLHTKVGEGHSNTAVEEDPSDKDLSVVQLKDIPNDKPELNQQSGPVLTSPIELVPNIEEPVKSATQVPQDADDFHLEATDTVKPQEKPDYTSVEEYHQAVPDQTDLFEGEHYPIKDGGTQTIPSAVAPVVNAEVISVGDTDADNMTQNVYSSSDVAMGGSIQENVTSSTVVPSQADLVDLTKNATAHEINIVGSTYDVEEKAQNEKSVVDLATHEINEVNITEPVDEKQQDKESVVEPVEEKQQDKESVADSISHLTNAVSGTDNYGENEKETITPVSSCNIPNTSSIEEEKQIEEVITDPAPEKTDVTSNREDVEEDKQIEVDVKTNREISAVCTTEAIEEKDTTSVINSENIISNIEDKEQSEEINAEDISDGTGMICSTDNDGKMHNEDTTDYPTQEKTVVHRTDDVEEKNENTVVDPNSHNIDRVEDMKNDETSADFTTPGINAALASEEKKNGEPTFEPISSKISTVGDVEEKQQSEETKSDQISGEGRMQQRTYASENGMQSKDTTTVSGSEKSEVAEKTDAAEGTEQDKETTAKEISTVQSTDDLKGAGQNEEIADKEVIVDSDKSHVSLKVLLADKNVETKEKKPSTKDRVLSFRRRSSKDSESPVKPGSPKAASGQQDWNSPARLPAEKKKGKKQQWVPFICCPSIH